MMRRHATHWLMFGFLLLGLAGCKSNGTNGDDPTTTTESTEATEAPEAPEATESAEEATPTATRQRMMMATCPMGVSDTSVAMMSEGEMLGMNFQTSSADEVDELRTRVRQMVEMHNTYHEASGDAGAMNQKMQGRMMMGKGKGMRMRMHQDEQMHGFMMGTTAKYVETEDGARVDFEVPEEADRAQMEEMLQNRVQRMGTGTCPYMMGMMEPSGS